jgi:HK97 family phage portal protein
MLSQPHQQGRDMKFPKLFTRETKESRAGSTMIVSMGQPAWSGRNYAAFADEGFRKNVVAYQSISKISDAVASVRWTVWRGDKELTGHPLLALLKSPNPAQSGPQYMRAKIGFFMISGNGYEERVAVGGKVRELYQLRPDRVKVMQGGNGFPSGYIYEANGKRVQFDVDPVTLEGDVRHIKAFNPLDDWYGLSPIEAASYAIDQHNESMSWMQSLLQNSARPSGALVSTSDTPMADDQFDRLKAQIEGQYSGAKNAGRPMLLEGGLDWRQMGLSPTDMGIIEAKYSSARDVALGLGVPPQLLGIPGDNTYANYAEARLAFWEDTVIPLLDLITEDWNTWLAEPYGVELRPDMDHVPAIVEKKARLWDMADKATDLTINERRGLKGFEPIVGGDEVLVASSQVGLASALSGSDTLGDTADMKAWVYGQKAN